jgi:hypothetical protein
VGKSIIRGRVTDAGSGAPLRRVQVTTSIRLSDSTAQSVVALTNEQGRYEFRALPLGRYQVSASKAGYVTLVYGQRRQREGGLLVEIDEGQVVDRIDIALPKAAVIVVRLTDDAGEAVAGMGVTVQQYTFSGGERRLSTVGGNVTVGTNDLGLVRLTGIQPGEYYVRADFTPRSSGVDADGRVLAPTYYPGTLAVAEAQRILVAGGQEVRADFSVIPVKPALVRGVVRGSNGALLKQPSVSLRATGTTAGRSMVVTQDGGFSLINVMPGDYTIDVSPSATTGNDEAEYANVPIQVTGEDVSDLVVTTRKAATLRGRLVFGKGTTGTLVAPMQVSVQLTAGGNSPPRQLSNKDGTFELGGITGPGLIRLRQPVQPGWYLRAVM